MDIIMATKNVACYMYAGVFPSVSVYVHALYSHKISINVSIIIGTFVGKLSNGVY